MSIDQNEIDAALGQIAAFDDAIARATSPEQRATRELLKAWFTSPAARRAITATVAQILDVPTAPSWLRWTHEHRTHRPDVARMQGLPLRR